MKPAPLALAALAVAHSLYSAPALGQQPPEAHAPEDRAVFVFGGRMGASHFEEMLIPFAADYEDAIVLGGGYQHYFAEPLPDFHVGLEVGAVMRAGEKFTGEIWGGAVGRHAGFILGDTLRVSPSLTFGVSVVSDTMGIEARREAGDGLSGDILFYFSPELSFASTESPETEVFWRLHHRSGAWNTFGGGGSADATTIGIRTYF